MKHNSPYDTFTISEFAKLTNVTAETLRHYHRMGILSPSYIDPDTGYRYYTMLEFENVGVIQALQSLGIPLKEIQTYLNSKTVAYSYRLLSQQYSSVCKQLESLMQTKKYIKEKMESMEMLVNNRSLNQVFEKTIHKRHGYTTLTPCTNYRQYQSETARLMETYSKNLFLSNSFAVICDYNNGHPLFYSLVMDIQKPCKIESEEKKFPPNLYITVQFQGTFENSMPSIQKAFAYINKHHYTICGDMLMLCIVDENYTNIPEERITELQIPVQKPDK